jgi:hypothetical protein
MGATLARSRFRRLVGDEKFAAGFDQCRFGRDSRFLLRRMGLPPTHDGDQRIDLDEIIIITEL